MDFAQLRKEILDAKIPLSVILRKAYVFFKRTNNSEIINWIEMELNGYDDSLCKDWENFPEYRKPHGQPKAFYTVNHNTATPLRIHNDKLYEKISRLCFHYSIAQIESIISENSDSHFWFTLPKKNEQLLQKSLGENVTPVVEYSKDSFVAMLNHVRNKLLKIVLANESNLRKLNIDDSSEITEASMPTQINANQINIYNEGKNLMNNDFVSVGGDIVYGDKAGADLNKISAQNILNSFNKKISDSDLSPELMDLFAQLSDNLVRMCEKLSSDDAKKVARDFDNLTEEVLSKTPRKQWYELSAQGLIEAAKSLKDFAIPVMLIVQEISKLLSQ